MGLETHERALAAGMAAGVCVMDDGDVIGRGTHREVFYGDDLLERANLRPPTAVRVARDAGLDVDSRPVTEADLVELLSDHGMPSEPIRAESLDGTQKK